jgi:hypothetical protein
MAIAEKWGINIMASNPVSVSSRHRKATSTDVRRGAPDQQTKSGAEHDRLRTSVILSFPPDAAPVGSSQAPPSNDGAPVRIVADLEEESEYLHRMRVNFFAAALLIALITIGVWIADAMVDTQKAHGCYTSGERSCSSI